MSLNCCAMTGVKSQGNVEESFKRDKSRRKTKKSGNFAWGQSQWKLPTELWKKGRDLLRIFQRQKKINGEWNLINIMTKFTSSSHSVQKGYSHAPSERDERGGQARKEKREVKSRIITRSSNPQMMAMLDFYAHCCKTKIHLH